MDYKHGTINIEDTAACTSRAKLRDYPWKSVSGAISAKGAILRRGSPQNDSKRDLKWTNDLFIVS